MAQTTENRAVIAFKKVLGKAHTDDDKAIGNEADSSYVQTLSGNVISKTISTTPATAVSDGTVEQVTAAVFVEDVTSNGHAYFLNYPAGWSGSRGSPGARITGAVPTSVSNSYEIAITAGGSPLAVLDARNWVYDYENGVFFQQTPSASPAPATADLWIVHADTFLDRVLDTKVDQATAIAYAVAL